MSNVIYLKPKNDKEEFFETDSGYLEYVKAEEELRKKPLESVSFDWMGFLRYLFTGR